MQNMICLLTAALRVYLRKRTIYSFANMRDRRPTLAFHYKLIFDKPLCGI